MPLCIEYDIVHMSSAASHGGMDPSGPVFNDSAAQIWLNLSDGIGYVDFKGIGRLRLIGIDLQLQETPQEKVQQGQIARSLWPIHITSARDNHTLKLFMKNVHRCVRCMAYNTVLLEPHVIYVHIVQFGPKEIRYHPSVALTIDGDGITNVILKKVWTNDAAGNVLG